MASINALQCQRKFNLNCESDKILFGEHLPSRGEMDEAELLPRDARYVAAHCAIYTKTADSRRALVLMHMRFDGNLGFAGGLIDPEDASVVQGLNRELREELNLDTSRFEIKDEDFVMCRHGLIKLRFYVLYDVT